MLVVEQDGRLLLGDPAAPLRLAAPSGFLTHRGVGYRGALSVEDGPAGLLLVNTVDLEEYLASVVGAEMPAAWPREALRAQAVAARTYLLARRPLNGNVRYDICATERCQVYRGLGSEAASTRQAVRDTEGEVLTYHDRLINALYSSNSGGVTEAAEHVFGASAPYLRSVASPGDADAAVFRWTRELRAEELLAALNAERVGALRGVAVPARSPTGRAATLRLDGVYGSVEVPATTARSALGLRSTMFWPTFQPAATIVVSAGDLAARQATRPAGGRRVGLLAEERPRSAAEARALDAYWVYALPPRVQLDGRGWGHGVGMSQWGARGMALAGATYRAILAHYYSGTTLRADYGG
ncbi:MAG: SpoIID/LytB domain-containing protein [Chloroflexi bacterium]|nr:SpoIID/LytB domain-containing protein [Chloroflexota bacterium]